MSNLPAKIVPERGNELPPWKIMLWISPMLLYCGISFNVQNNSERKNTIDEIKPLLHVPPIVVFFFLRPLLCPLPCNFSYSAVTFTCATCSLWSEMCVLFHSNGPKQCTLQKWSCGFDLFLYITPVSNVYMKYNEPLFTMRQNLKLLQKYS